MPKSHRFVQGLNFTFITIPTKLGGRNTVAISLSQCLGCGDTA